jgi:hypothetical protein
MMINFQLSKDPTLFNIVFLFIISAMWVFVPAKASSRLRTIQLLFVIAFAVLHVFQRGIQYESCRTTSTITYPRTAYATAQDFDSPLTPKHSWRAECTTITWNRNDGWVKLFEINVNQTYGALNYSTEAARKLDTTRIIHVNSHATR